MTDVETRILAAVARLDDAPDPLHLDMTPAVLALAELGTAVIPHLEAGLASPSELTRLHAQRALEHVLYRHLGFRPGSGWDQPDGEASFRRLWGANGAYAFDGPPTARSAAIERWMAWASAQRP